MLPGRPVGRAVALPLSSRTAPTKRTPLRGKVFISRCSSPVSPIAPRAALMRLARQLGNDAPVPDRGQQIVLGDDPVAVSHQMNKKIENLGLDSDKRTSPAQFPPIRVEYACPRNNSARQRFRASPPAHVRKCNTGSPNEKWREP